MTCYLVTGVDLLLILFSVWLQDIYLEEKQLLQQTLVYLNIMFAIFFFIEMLLKWFAYGFKKYFTSFWTILDFVIVNVSIVMWLVVTYCQMVLLLCEL